MMSEVSYAPIDKAADCARFAGPGDWLQTDMCMPYGPRLHITTHNSQFVVLSRPPCQSRDPDASRTQFLLSLM